MKKIALTKGKFAVVDDADFKFLNQWRWKYHKDNYAVRTATGNKQIYMHREVNKTPHGILTDHINRNGLDNRRKNLRITTYSKNLLNTGKWKHNTSGAKGVQWNKQKAKWHALIQINWRVMHLGYYSNFKQARLARLNGEKLYAI